MSSITSKIVTNEEVIYIFQGYHFYPIFYVSKKDEKENPKV